MILRKVAHLPSLPTVPPPSNILGIDRLAIGSQFGTLTLDSFDSQKTDPSGHFDQEMLEFVANCMTKIREFELNIWDLDKLLKECGEEQEGPGAEKVFELFSNSNGRSVRNWGRANTYIRWQKDKCTLGDTVNYPNSTDELGICIQMNDPFCLS